MEELKCLSCGGKVDINEELMIGVCEYCGTEQALPEGVVQSIKKKKKELQDKIDAEKRDIIKRKFIKVMKIIIPSLAVLIAFIIILFTLILPSIKYNNAVDLMENNNYINAAERFKVLNHFKDSASKWQECEYKQANIYLTEEKYREAVLLLEKIGSYKDSGKLIKQYKFYKLKIGELINFGVYEQDNAIYNGSESISWRVLAIEESKVLLLSEKCLDCVKFDYYNSQWELSDLRKWLNANFINTAFTSEEKSKIVSVTLKNEDSKTFGYYSNYSKDDTIDKIFLLSENEFLYYSKALNLSAKPTAYAISKGASVNLDKGTCYWWLRTAHVYKAEIIAVLPTNEILPFDANVKYIGVRPAIWIKLDTPQ